MSNIRSLIVCSILSSMYVSCIAMVTDNRYFPFFPKPYSRTQDRPSRFGAELFFMSSDKGYGDREEDVGLPEIWGRYDQTKLSAAMIKAGFASPLLDEWRGFDIKWRLDGKLQAQGISFFYDQALTENISCGAQWLFMRVHAWHEFFYNTQDSNLRLTSPADELELDQIRRTMHQRLGIYEPSSTQLGFGDIDAYIRYGSISEYICKFRRMDLGVRLGVLVPSGNVQLINSPASVPFGGNGHWGLYVSAEGEFELKEDLIAGIMLRATKRLARTTTMRMPVVLSETPQQFLENSALYGVVVAPVQVNPGATIFVSPYVTMENVRAGLGARAQYCLSVHTKDCVVDKRENKADCMLAQATLEEKTRFASDYVSLAVFYDFGKVSVEEGMSPKIQVTWDLPALLFKAENISKTHKISLGLELHF